ncbi:MAG: selenium cofactor biosynthesis protein YqeC [Pseudomonadota bacterium]
MRLSEALTLNPDKAELICLVGGGGKTSAMFSLARELKDAGKKVLVTTTTNMASDEVSQADEFIIAPKNTEGLLIDTAPGTIVCLAGKKPGLTGKVSGVSKELIDALHRERIFDCILVEADGAKRKPIKAPADYEPVIPSGATMTIGVIGIDALRKRITDEHVHRPELFCTLAKKHMGQSIDRYCLMRLILSKKGLFKDVPPGCRKYVLLNKADYTFQRKIAKVIVRETIQHGTSIAGFIIASIRRGHVYNAWQRKNKWSAV